MVPADRGPFHLDDYVGYVREFIRHIGAERLHVVAVCQPTVPVLAAVALMAGGRRAPAAQPDHDGRPDRRPPQPDRGQQAGHRPPDELVREQRDPQRARIPTRARGRRVYPGFLQHAGFMAMNPDAPHRLALGLLPAPGRGRPATAPRSTAGSTTSTTPCWTCPPSTTSTPSASCSSSTCSRAGSGTSPASGCARGDHPLGAADHRRRAGRHLRHRPDPGRARPLPRHPAGRKHHLTIMGAGHYGIFSGRRWREKIYPQVRDFIATADQAA